MLSTTSYASRLGLAIDANLTTEVVKVLKGTFQVNASMSLVQSIQVVAAACILGEVKIDPPVPGYAKARDLVKKCVAEGTPLSGSSLR